MKPNWDANIVKVLSKGLSTKRDLDDLEETVNKNSANIVCLDEKFIDLNKRFVELECAIKDHNRRIEALEGLYRSNPKSIPIVGDSETKKKTPK
jgi:predicted  nucleic acid-binding Zn-ribbon protein